MTPGITHTGQIVRADSAGIAIKVGENEFTVPRASLLRADVAKPDGLDKSLAAQRAGKFQDALAGFKAIVDRYAGLPLPWAEDCILRLGEVQISLKDYNGAKKTFDSFKVFYPKSGSLAVLDAKYARILVEQNQPDKAMPMIQGILEPLLKREFLTDEQEAGVAQGLVLLGDCQVAAGKTDDALDNYLKVVTLFDVDSDRTTEAKYKAGKLLDQRGNWRRAKQIFNEIVKDDAESAFAVDAKKRLADLNKAHPE